MTKKAELIRNAAAVVAAFVASVFLIEYGLKLPNKLDERNARALRRSFCEHLLNDDKAGALALVPESGRGSTLATFLNRPGKIVECKERGFPEPANSPGPGECGTLRQGMIVNRDPQSAPTFRESQGNVYFVYSCTSLSSWKSVAGVFVVQ